MGGIRKVQGVAQQLARKILTSGGFQATPNATVLREIVSLPVALGPHRIEAVSITAGAVPLDADGTLLLSVSAFDVSEGASDNIVVSQDLETLMLVAHKAYDCLIAAETAEKERIIEGGDTIWCQIVNNSAAIDTNPFFTVTVTLLPLDQLFDKSVRRRQQYNP